MTLSDKYSFNEPIKWDKDKKNKISNLYYIELLANTKPVKTFRKTYAFFDLFGDFGGVASLLSIFYLALSQSSHLLTWVQWWPMLYTVGSNLEGSTDQITVQDPPNIDPSFSYPQEYLY